MYRGVRHLRDALRVVDAVGPRVRLGRLVRDADGQADAVAQAIPHDDERVGQQVARSPHGESRQLRGGQARDGRGVRARAVPRRHRLVPVVVRPRPGVALAAQHRAASHFVRLPRRLARAHGGRRARRQGLGRRVRVGQRVHRQPLHAAQLPRLGVQHAHHGRRRPEEPLATPRRAAARHRRARRHRAPQLAPRLGRGPARHVPRRALRVSRRRAASVGGGASFCNKSAVADHAQRAHARARGRLVRPRRGPLARHRRPDRRGEVDHRPAPVPVLRRRRGLGPRRRRRRAQGDAVVVAPPPRRRAAGHGPLQRVDRVQHPLRRSRQARPRRRRPRRARRRRARREARRALGLRVVARAGLRDDRRRARAQAVGRREAARRHRAALRQEPPRRAARRGDVGARLADRTRHPARAQGARRGADLDRHRAPPLDHRRRRRDPRAARRPRRRVRHAPRPPRATRRRVRRHVARAALPGDDDHHGLAGRLAGRSAAGLPRRRLQGGCRRVQEERRDLLVEREVAAGRRRRHDRRCTPKVVVVLTRLVLAAFEREEGDCPTPRVSSSSSYCICRWVAGRSSCCAATVSSG
mmetsp:Transcript_25643/g.102242  ORF Transcript_25643/g.102242 Transcript_25643/m.102242 type:complete len:584 (+) Transcript_25643:1037-2788(+)